MLSVKKAAYESCWSLGETPSTRSVEFFIPWMVTNSMGDYTALTHILSRPGDSPLEMDQWHQIFCQGMIQKRS